MVKNNVNFIKTTVYYGPKKEIGNRIPFVRIFNDKISALVPIFCQKNIKSLKNTLLSCPCFIKQASILSKTRCSHVIFSNFSLKSLPVRPIFGKKNVNSVKTKLYYRPNRSLGHLIWSEFTGKITALMHIFYQKRQFSKNTLYTCS